MLAQEGVARQLHRAQVQGLGHVPGRGREEGIGQGPVDDGVAVAPGEGRAAGVECGRLGGGLPDDDGGGEQPVAGALEGGGLDRGRLGVPGGGDHVDVHHLPPGVDPGVGPARADQLHRVAHDPLDGRPQHPGHGALARLGGEAVKAAAVIGDEQAQADQGPGRRRRPGAGSGSPGVPVGPADGGVGLGVGVEQRHGGSAGAPASAADHHRGTRVRAQTSSMRAMGALSPWRGPSLRMRV